MSRVGLIRVGLISDTHGLLRPQALAALQGSDHIIHAGDIGSAEILQALGRIAPLSVVRGNNDRDAWAEDVPEIANVSFGAVRVHVLHDLHDLAIAALRGVAVVVSGHSHKPHIERRDSVLYVNPGSAGPRRFKLPVTVGGLSIDGTSVQARIFELPA